MSSISPSIANAVVRCTFSATATGLGNSHYTVQGVSLGNFQLLQANYYDNYDFLSQSGFTDRTTFPTGTVNAKGLQTGSILATLEGGTPLYEAYYYDLKGRVTKQVRTNLLGGADVTTTAYTLTDKPSSMTHTHTASGKTTRTETYGYTYDQADRLTKATHSLGGTQATLASYAYDDLGRLQTKNLHGNAGNQQTYAYNLRSWLTGIGGSKFAQNLYYTTGNGTKQYNGNLSSLTWKAGNETTLRGYKFSYDGLDRLTTATYGEGTSIATNADRFTEKVTGYDKNGNILGLQRYGQTSASAYGLVDNLTFTLSGNQLTRVDDAATASAYNNGFEFKDAVKQANEYAYDPNGNLSKDLNKNISSIQYNCLNLPSKVTFGDGSAITYTYSADGTKLRAVYVINGSTTTTDYCGNVVYENGTQKWLLTDEGYVSLSDGQYHYYLKDHQGNNRVVINSAGTVEETNHYYPFGGTFASTNTIQPYKYNGKEYDAKKGLNWYDYGARWYDAATGRFTTNDRFAEKYYALSTYQYGANNPVNNVDVNGDSIVIIPNPNGIVDYIKMLLGYDTKFQRAVKTDLTRLKSDNQASQRMITTLEESDQLHIITLPKKGKGNASVSNRFKAEKRIRQGSVIKYNPYNRYLNSGEERNPRASLAHELQHSFDVDQGLYTTEETENGIPIPEVRAINMENKIRLKTNDVKRTKYGEKEIPEELLE